MDTIQLSNRFFTSINESDFKRTAKSSKTLVDWYVRHSITTGTTKLVASTIASFYSPKNGYAIISNKKIRAATGLSEATISHAIKEMKFSGEWIVYKIEHGEPYSTYQRYAPLPPITVCPGKFLSLAELSNKIYEREKHKNNTKFKVKKLASDYYTIWESYWGAEFILQSAPKIVDSLTSKEQDFINSILSNLLQIKDPVERQNSAHVIFTHLRGTDFPKRGYTVDEELVELKDFSVSEKEKLILRIYKNWTEDLLKVNTFGQQVLKFGYGA